MHHHVGHHAARLGITPARLSRLVARVAGKTTQRLIDEWLMLETKHYPRYTPLILKEIAFVLGYADPFHLSKTFKRLIGLNPHAYRERVRRVT